MIPLGQNRWLIAAIVVVVFGLGFRIGSYPLMDPDEGRNAEIAREMAESNNYVVPRLNGLPYLDKPVLYFAATAATMEALGHSEFAARLPSLLFTLATLMLVGWFGHTRVAPWAGAIAVAATGATPLTLAFARTVIFDSALTFFVVLSIFSFYSAAEFPRGQTSSSDRGRAAWWTSLGWLGLALGVLTKGPIAIGLPLMVVLPYLGWRRRWDVLWDAVGVLLFVAVLLPWLLAMSRVVPDFLEYALITETVKRFATDELQRSEPLWYFLPIVVAGALPWSLVAIAGWKKGRPSRDASGRWDRRLVLLCLWILVPLVFFSLSQSKRPQYLLPLMPAIGLLVALLWSGASNRAFGARGAGLALSATGLTLLFARPIVGALLALEPDIAEAIPGTAIILGTVCLVAGAATFLLAAHKQAAVLALCVPVATIPAASVRLMQAIGDDRSSRSMATAIEQILTPETEIVAVQTYPLSLPFYLQQTLIVATADGSELTSNFLARTHRRWIGVPGSPYRSADWWLEALEDCRRPLVFVIRNEDARARDILTSRVPLIAANRKVSAYGPCGMTDLATNSGPSH